jgi:serine/threonine protein kinase
MHVQNNILVNDQKETVLCDLNSAVLHGTPLGLSSSSDIHPGTAAWTAPEHIFVNENPTLQGDIWSLGCLLFEILTGKQPFFGYSASHCAVALALAKKESPLGECSQPLCVSKKVEAAAWELMKKCCSWEPNDRPTVDYVLFELRALSSRNDMEDVMADGARSIVIREAHLGTLKKRFGKRDSSFGLIESNHRVTVTSTKLTDSSSREILLKVCSFIRHRPLADKYQDFRSPRKY